MTVRKLLLVAFTLICIAACLGLPFVPVATQPFDTKPIDGGVVMQVLPSPLGLSMPAGLEAGDRIHLEDLTPRDRAYFLDGVNAPAGTTLDLVVRRTDGLHHVAMTFQPVGLLNLNAADRVIQSIGYVLVLVVTALGLVLLWRGRNLAASGMALWCFTLLLEGALQTVPMPSPFGFILNRVGNIGANTLTLVGLYIVAVSLAGSALAPARRRLLHWIFAAVVTVYSAGNIFFTTWFYFDITLSSGSSIVLRVIHMVGFAIPVGLLVAAYSRATTVNQARIRWVLFSMVGLVASYLVSITPPSFSISSLVLNITSTVLIAATFSGFAYAVLKHQLVSLQVVLNRALVYGLITSLVVGVFAAVLSLLEHATLNTETNRTLALIVPLLLGMGLNTLKRYVDAYINKLFFRHRHRAEESLSQFARTCAYVEDPEKLLDLTADELFRHGAPQALAIYLTEPGKAGAKLVRQRGNDSYAKHLDIDDLGFLRLRAGDLEVDLHGIASSLGTEGNVYAFTVRGQVLGFIVLGARPAEAYTSEER
ncbi:MAG TPA: hypothetical protein VGM47_00455, partial [Gammaproteobacteria bacterium]